MLNDKEIRDTLLLQIKKENLKHECRIINEMGICNGDARVDIAVANGRLCGYEIKSDIDTLDRLSNQIDAYNKTFDKITIVVGRKYENKIVSIVPAFWGIKVAYNNKFDKVSIKNIRSAKINRNTNVNSLLELLWKDELYKFLKDNGIKGISKKNVKQLRDIALETISPKLIKEYTLDIIKHRENWRVD